MKEKMCRDCELFDKCQVPRTEKVGPCPYYEPKEYYWRERVKLVLNELKPKTNEVILDFGCGVGRITEHMAKDFKRVVGVDISPTMIAQGRKRLKVFKNIKFLETDGVNIPLPENSFDFVFSYLVFQHIKDRNIFEGAFREILPH